MPMTPAGLKAQIISELNSQGFNISNPATGGEADKYIEAISKAIVEYIQANGQAVDPGGTGPNNHPIV